MYLYVYALEGILLGPKECALKFGLRDLDLKNFARFSSFFFFLFLSLFHAEHICVCGQADFQESYGKT